MERLRVIKVKRRLGEDSLPDLLLLDHTVDLKRSRRITGIYERIADAEEDETVLVARIKPSTLETLSRLQGTSVYYLQMAKLIFCSIITGSR